MSAQQIASTATYTGSGAAVVFGLTPSEWSVVGVIGGLLIALAGFAVNIYFKRKHFKLAMARAAANALAESDD